ncbi:MAG TPA: GrpB family protein [Candidatus Binatia bacterium]
MTPSEKRIIRAERRADELVTIHDYDPRWPALFAAERAEITRALGDVLAVEHMGSTAVPGLPAKPIVDIIASVDRLALTDAQITALGHLGYEHLGACGVPGRAYFRKLEPYQFNLHVVQSESSLWDHNLLFRDYLQAHPDEARRYGSLKRKLACDAGHSLLLYSDRKGRFISRTLERAREWRRDLMDTTSPGAGRDAVMRENRVS